ncbi:Lrp/AsnC ligand binding domain-containing protein, partial [Amylibacter sp.]|nr:Lrp/AsnC ligand binding domain-containing protein [Amylibacter sp.]
TSWAEKFDKVVKCFPEIIGAHRMAGDLDYILRVRVRDVKDYDNFYQTLISKISISDISASFVMDDIKDTTALPTDRM